MFNHEKKLSTVSSSWDKYWHGSERSGAYSADGTSHPAVLEFWTEFFGANQDNFKNLSVVDFASGSGAVIKSAETVFGKQLPEFTCIDISKSAIQSLLQRYPNAHGIVADVRSIPLQSAQYDVVTSQFGIEYAGLDTIDEAMRLVSPHGLLAMLIHHRHGGIYRQCAASVTAIRQLTAADFIPRATAMFDEGFKMVRGAEQSKYKAAARQFAPAIRAMESIMQQYGNSVADGTILRLYRDIRGVHERMPNYDPGAVLDWLRRMQTEIEAYAGRMQSMCESAIDARAFEVLCRRIENDGFDLTRRDPLVIPDRGEPLAWALLATRS